MSVEKTKKVIRDFLLNSSAEVLSVKGDWGVGKTYFWNEAINQAKDEPKFCREKYCYISLFGITNLEQLKSMIFETYEDRAGIGKGFSFDNLTNKLLQYGRASGAAVSRIGDKLLDKQLGDYLPTGLLASVLPFTFHTVKDMLICIDDLERKSDSLSMKEVLGLISSLKEERRNCKVALIFSDTNFTKDDKELYAHFREKVVDVEVRFSPTPIEAANLVFTSTDNVDAQLREFTNALQISNIRILQRIKRAADITVPLLREFDPKITHAALQTLALFGWSYYSHTHDENVPSFSYVTTFGYHLGGEKTEQQQGWNALLQKYGFRATDKLDVALSSLIENGFIDEGIVRKEAKELNQQLFATNSIDAFAEAWNIFYSFHTDEEEVVRTFEKLLKQHVIYVSPLNLNGVIEILRELNRDGLASELIDFYVRARGKDRGIFDISRNLLPFGVKPDKELANKFDLQLAALEETPTLEKALAHIAQDEGWSSAEEKAVASATPDGFITLFKSAATRELLDSYLKASLKFGRLGELSDRQMAIAQNVKEALLKIANESPMNKIRVKRYGINVEEQPRLPL